jgi:hypothetical protein
MKNPKIPIYPEGSRASKTAQGAAWLFGILLAISVPVCWCCFLHKQIEYVYVFAAFWSITPPIWFWYEYYWIYRVDGEPESFELFKYGQDVAKAVWAAAALTFGALAASSYFKS